MNRRPVIQTLPEAAGREIAISDIHGDLESYTKLLKKIHFDPEKDRLILAGDLVEKGFQNLDLLHLIMEQCKTGSVFAMMGNCDFVAKNILFSYRLEFLRSVLLKRKGSLIHEMTAKLHLPEIDASTDMEELAAALRKAFLPELTFLNSLPHVIETPKRVYAHSGVPAENDYGFDFRYIMTRNRFLDEDQSFIRPLVVGHMPVSEYCLKKADFNCRYDGRRNVYSIDGGNIVKPNGQLNALIFHQNFVEDAHVDCLPKAEALVSTHPDNRHAFYLSWAGRTLDIQQKQEQQTLVYSKWLHRQFWIDNEFLQDTDGTDFTSYEIPVRKGDIVSLCRIGKHKAFIKKNGIYGWTHPDNLKALPFKSEL